MKTNGTKAYKLFNRAFDALGTKYKFELKGANQTNLHAIFMDRHHYTYALKVVLNKDNNEIETYLAIANAFAHESHTKIKTLADLHKVIAHSHKMRELAQLEIALEKIKNENKNQD